MTAEILSFLVGFISFTIYAFTVLILLRMTLSVSPVIIQFVYALMVHIIAILGSSLILKGLPYWHGAALFWFCFNIYLFIYSAVYKSISLKILSTLSRCSSKSETVLQITNLYILPSFVERINILTQANYAVQNNEQFTITNQGKKMATRIITIQKLFV